MVDLEDINQGTGEAAEPPKEKLPKVRLPFTGRSESDFAKEIVEKLPLHKLFRKQDFNVEVDGDEALGVANGQLIIPFGIVTSKFREMKPKRFVTWVEQYINIGVERVNKNKEVEFLSNTMSNEQAEHILEGDAFTRGLPRILRILDIPIPVRTIHGDIVYPVPGYNPQIMTYCDRRIPIIEEIDYQQALDILTQEVYGEFTFHNEQSRTHAYARMITPYSRGVLGFGNRVPLWFYEGNRPGAGKDYCNGCTQLTYLGRAFEDAPLGHQDETWKRISAALQAGRRMMYFANCVNNLNDPHLATAITDTEFNCRTLGTNSAKSDLRLPMEMDFALSANGLTHSEDYVRRVRRITLSFFEEDTNSRIFRRPDLWGWILENRLLILRAIHTLFLKWVREGCPEGTTPFTSFPAWGKTVGGILMVNGLGDPCLPQGNEFSSNPEETALAALWEIMHNKTGGEPIQRPKVYPMIAEAQHGAFGLGNGDERLDFFGSLREGDKDAAFNKNSLGILLTKSNGRIFKGIKMEIDKGGKKQTNPARQTLTWSKL